MYWRQCYDVFHIAWMMRDMLHFQLVISHFKLTFRSSIWQFSLPSWHLGLINVLHQSVNLKEDKVLPVYRTYVYHVSVCICIDDRYKYMYMVSIESLYHLSMQSVYFTLLPSDFKNASHMIIILFVSLTIATHKT